MHIKALALWRDDSGTQWGARGNATDLPLSAPDYATVPASQFKCNAYVCEVLYRSRRLVYKVYESDQQAGKYFPYKAAAGDAIRVRLTHPEKHAYYLLGHWLEAVWQFQVPLAALGVAALVIAWFVAPRR